MIAQEEGRSRLSGAAEGDGAAWTRIARPALDVAGVGLCVAGLWLLARTFFRWPIQPLDEGILLTGAMLVRHGKALYRDVYTNYPPGIFWTIVGLWNLFGVSTIVLRGLGLGLHAGLALVSGRLAGRAAGRRFSWLAAGLVLTWTALLMDVPYAWLAALLAAFLGADRIARTAGSARRGPWIAAGLAFGAVGCYRHDLLVYLVLVLATFAAAWAVRSRRLRPSADVVRGGALGLAAAAAVLAVVWIPTLARAGVRAVAADLLLDQVRYVMPSRTLPLPDLVRLAATPFGARLPALAVRPFEGAVGLSLAGPLLGVLALLLVLKLERRLDRGVLVLSAISVAVLPQLLGRTDLFHALFTVAPALVFGATLTELAASWSPSRLRPVAATALVVAFALPVALHLPGLLGLGPPSGIAGPSARYGGLPESSEGLARARRDLFAFLDRHGRPGDAVFFGCRDHRSPVLSETDLYFLADRTAATRYVQFDPGLIGRREVQERIVRELEASAPRAAVLSGLTLLGEPQRAGAEGSTILDDYLRTRYEVAGASGPYLFLVRR